MKNEGREMKNYIIFVSEVLEVRLHSFLIDNFCIVEPKFFLNHG